MSEAAPFQGLADLASAGAGRERHLHSGEVLFRQGEQGNHFYYVRRGRLRVLRANDNGARDIVGEVGRGEVVGEMAVLGDATRSATVVATRDCDLTEIPGELVASLPKEALMDVMRLLATRMRDMLERGGIPHGRLPRCITVLPLAADVPVIDYCQHLGESLRDGGKPPVIFKASDLPAEYRDIANGSAASSAKLGYWLEDLEEQSELVLLIADVQPTAWTRRCLLQADLVLLVANAGGDPTPGEAERMVSDLPGADEGALPRIELVLFQESTPYRGTGKWLKGRNITRHYHVRLSSEADKARAARLLIGRDLSFALGGGGARGFAHVGLIRACQEMGIPVDRIGGTSMGAAVAALVAQELPWEEMVGLLRASFLPKWKLKQYTFPLIALDTGRKYSAMLAKLFGDIQIEDLPISYYCMTTNLTRAEPRVHRDGSLANWVSTSMSLPGYVPPFIDRGELHVDGGLLNNLPIDIAKSEGTGMAIGVDVSPGGGFHLPEDFTGRPRLWDAIAPRFLRKKAIDGSPIQFPNIATTLLRSACLSSVAQKEAMAKEADLFIRMPVDSIPILAFEELDKMVEIGYRTGLKTLTPAAELAGVLPQ